MGGILETPDLVVLGQEVRDGVEHQECQRKVLARDGLGHVTLNDGNARIHEPHRRRATWQDSVMPLHLVLVSDTHVPHRARDLPAQVWAAVESADVLLHAGDWVTAELLDQFERRSRRLIGVYGNNDGPELRRRLPETVAVTLEGVQFAMVHETGPARGRSERAESHYPDADVLVFGHSHIPWDTTTPRGLRLLNPGSPTDRRRQPVCTYMTAVVDGGLLQQVELVEVRKD